MKLLGLTSSQVKVLQQKYGPNDIRTQPRFNLLELLLRQFSSPLVLILFVAALLSFFVGDWTDAFLILGIVFLNGILGFYQEYKADRVLLALRKMATPFSRVLRDGQEIEVPSTEIVPGDIVALQKGSRVPADGRIVESFNLQINESALTGESAPAYKDNDQNSDVYSGTIAVDGSAKYEVLKTGLNSRFGRIASQIENIADEPTPLEKEIIGLGKKLGLLALVSSIILFIFQYNTTTDLKELFLTAISLAVAAVPEGLPAIITTTLAIGVSRMAKRKSIVKKLSSIEALGAVEIICTDKTGTLTTNQMRVKKFWVNSSTYEAGEKGIGIGDPHFSTLLKIAVNASSASLIKGADHQSFEVLGEPMDGAMLILADDAGVNPSTFSSEFEKIQENSFDQGRRLMSTVAVFEGRIESYIKGAPDEVVKNSEYILLNGKKKKLTWKMKEELKEVYEKYAHDGLRILACAFKEVKVSRSAARHLSRDQAEKGLVLVGFAGISDPPRKEVEQAALLSTAAGIKTVVITGDNELTASSVAHEVGLLKEGDEVLTGIQVDKMDDQEIIRVLPKIRIFARVTPEQKYRIVNLYQSAGYITAVTGDGVNDALALKKSDVGVAMGISGTDVAKEAADIVVTDDNYASIVSAVEEGRIIYDNLVKSVRFLISGNLSEILFILLSIGFSLPIPLYPVQILWINLVTDGLPALALSTDPKDPDVMRRPPRDRSRKIGDWRSMKVALFLGSAVGVITFLVYAVFLQGHTLDQSRSAAFTTIVMLQMVLVLVLRNVDLQGIKHIFRFKLKNNRLLILSILLTILMQIIILTNEPIAKIFRIDKFW